MTMTHAGQTRYAPFCSSCGARNENTRFCENCGQQAQVLPTIAAGPATPTDRSHRSRWWLAVLLTVAGLMLFDGVWPWFPYETRDAMVVIANLGEFVVAAVAVGAVLTSAVKPTTRTAVALVLVGVYLLTGPVFGLLLPVVDYVGWASILFQFIPQVALLASWLVSGGAAPKAYSSIAIYLGLLAFVVGALFLVGMTGLYVATAILWPLLRVLAVIVTAIVAERLGWPRNSRGVATASAAIPETNTLAILSLVFGIITAGVPAVILGHIALSQIRRTGQQGQGMAIAGLILGYIGLAAGLILLIVYVGLIGSIFGSLGSFSY